MSETYFSLSTSEQSDLLDTASAISGRPAHLLEKDVWVVWVLGVLFSSPFADWLTFKGGTSLSKGYKVIDRFSEDVDLTCDIRRLLPEMAAATEGIPPTASQASKWTRSVRSELPMWIVEQVVPVIHTALDASGINANLRVHGKDRDSLLLEYPLLKPGGGYAAPYIRLEFGARSTGEPCETLAVRCNLAPLIQEIVFPEALPRVMKMERTFWEKATAIHVFCRQGRLRGDRFARHWHDLLQLAKQRRIQDSWQDTSWLEQVVRHKMMFFQEKNHSGIAIDYRECLEGNLSFLPEGEAQQTLREDYIKMTHEGILLADVRAFDAVMEDCVKLQDRINALYSQIHSQ